MTDRFLPAVGDPIFLVISRREIELGQTDDVLAFLERISSRRGEAVAACGRLCITVEGYDADPRELFEIEEVRRFMRALDATWPYWFYFMNQVDDGLKWLESCLCDCIEVVPGVASIDSEQLENQLARHFAALESYCSALAIPPEQHEEISEGIIALFRNASVERIEGDAYQ